jgi:hypothetical protein
LEAGIVSSRKYFPLYFNSHQKVIHLLERVAKKGREQDRERKNRIRKRKNGRRKDFFILFLADGIHKGKKKKKKKVTVTDDALKIP